MAILRDDLTERESRAEAGNASGEADSAATATKTLFSRPGSGRGKGRAPRPTSLLPPARSPPPAWPACHCVSPESPHLSRKAWEQQHLRIELPWRGAAPTSPLRVGVEKKEPQPQPCTPGGGRRQLSWPLGSGSWRPWRARAGDTAGAGAQEDRRRTTFFFVSFCLSPRT